MAIRIKRKKKQQKRNPQYLAGKERTWVDQFRDENDKPFMKRFWGIIAIVVILLLIVIAFATTMILTANKSDNTSSISASDTYAVSTAEQNAMKNKAKEFATGMILYSYCSDPQTNLEGKEAALSCLAIGTDTYSKISDMTVSTKGNGKIAKDDIIPVVTNPDMQDGTQAYAYSYTYKLSATAADGSETNKQNPNGTIVDNGYTFELTFKKATDENTGQDSQWVISSALIYKKSSNSNSNSNSSN